MKTCGRRLYVDAYLQNSRINRPAYQQTIIDILKNNCKFASCYPNIRKWKCVAPSKYVKLIDIFRFIIEVTAQTSSPQLQPQFPLD